MPPSLTVLSLSNRDVKQIVDLVLPIQQEEFGIDITLADQPDLMDIEGVYIQTGGGFWGAFMGEELIGTLALLRFGRDGGALRKMFVRKPYRGKEAGVAARLLETLIGYGRENGIQDLYLGTVGVMKAALRFYEKNGFMPVSPASLPENFPRMPQDHVFYHLPLGKSTHP